MDGNQIWQPNKIGELATCKLAIMGNNKDVVPTWVNFTIFVLFAILPKLWDANAKSCYGRSPHGLVQIMGPRGRHVRRPEGKVGARAKHLNHGDLGVAQMNDS